LPNLLSLPIAALLLAGLAAPSGAMPPTSDEFDRRVIGGSQFYDPASPVAAPIAGASRTIAALQVLMDRLGISPGVIDGRDTPRLRAAFSVLRTNPAGDGIAGTRDAMAIADALANTGGDAFRTYAITADDIAGPFTPEIPHLYVHQASLAEIGFRDTREMLAERFHMDEAYLAALNADADFGRVGTIITVADPGRDLQRRIARIEAGKRTRQVRAFDAEGALVAIYPASIGSAATPSPTGSFTVRNKAQDPRYTYDPRGSAQPGLAEGLVLLPPGPNGPVGNAWIGLSKPTYGIHGTPEPSRIGLAESVGCIRLTNWDALELARLVRRGVKVTISD
jgi:lipoprotein-anchoring transpeptidase ErfK/SrfK